MRRSYRRAGLSETDLAPDPYTQFARWLITAAEAELPEPNAVILATADERGRPSARTVLLKGYDEAGFVFYTNYRSRKARDLAVNPHASLLFPWQAIDRQVTVLGMVSRVSAEQSAAYFRTRPRDSQLGAWASRQSTTIASRAELDERFAELAKRWPPGTQVPTPDFWGGYRLRPDIVEFWQGRESRLHDRLRYRRAEHGDTVGWVIERLAP